MDQAMIDDTVQKLKAAFGAVYRLRCHGYDASRSLFNTEQAIEESIGELARESFLKGKWVKWTLPEETP